MTRSRATNLTDSIFKQPNSRHCERSEAIHGAANAASEEWIASSHRLRPKAGFGGQECFASEAKQSMVPQMQQVKSGLLRRIRLRPKAGFGGQECSSQ